MSDAYADAVATRRATRGVAQRLVGSIAMLGDAAGTCTSLAARVEALLGPSKRDTDVAMVQQAGQAATALRQAVEGLTKAAQEANKYLAETL